MALENADITPATGDATIETTIDNTVDGADNPTIPADDTVLIVDDAPEPTVRELMARLDTQEKEIRKSNSRTQYLQRKIDRSNRVDQTQPAAKKPDEDDFQTNAEFVEALTDWKVDQRQRAIAETMTKVDSDESANDFFAVIDSGVDRYPDFNEVARTPADKGGPTITETMLEIMQESDDPIEIAYFFGKNVSESVRISKMSPLAAARAIGIIEAKVSGGTQRAPQKITTRTVTPSSPVTGKTIAGQKLESMSTKDFFESRNKAFGVR